MEHQTTPGWPKASTARAHDAAHDAAHTAYHSQTSPRGGTNLPRLVHQNRKKNLPQGFAVVDAPGGELTQRRNRGDQKRVRPPRGDPSP